MIKQTVDRQKADCAQLWSSSPGFGDYATSGPSRLVRHLAQVSAQYSHRMSLLDMVLIVNDRMKNERGVFVRNNSAEVIELKQHIWFEHGMNLRCYFQPVDINIYRQMLPTLERLYQVYYVWAN